MAQQLVSLADAATILGLSVERVRQLVVTGDLPGVRFGNAWAVPRQALLVRRHLPGSRGRPLGARRAWQEIVEGGVKLDRPGRYRNRALVVRCEMSRSDLSSLPGSVGAMHSGVQAAPEYGADVGAPDEERDLYLSRSGFERLPSLVALVRDPIGPIRLRVVADEVWKIVPSGLLAPRGAVALDLLEASDPRHWTAAEELLRDQDV